MPEGENQSSLPSFVVIGAATAGTETLNAWLNDHPDVCMSPREGLDFFLEDGTWDMGVGWYALRFGTCGWDQIRGESSPAYADTHIDPGVPKRMYSVIPDAKLIYLVREPMERMRSVFRQRVTDGSETRNFAEAVTDDPDYQETSRYITHIGAFLKHFPKKQLLVITSEQLAADPQAGRRNLHERHLPDQQSQASSDDVRDGHGAAGRPAQHDQEQRDGENRQEREERQDCGAHGEGGPDG